jgi:xanthine dehydrogenase iron-sulfur cluster and FAD-binding subunit A
MKCPRRCSVRAAMYDPITGGSLHGAGPLHDVRTAQIQELHKHQRNEYIVCTDADSALLTCTHRIALSTFLMQAGRLQLLSCCTFYRHMHQSKSSHHLSSAFFISVMAHVQSVSCCDNCILWIKMIDQP